MRSFSASNSPSDATRSTQPSPSPFPHGSHTLASSISLSSAPHSIPLESPTRRRIRRVLHVRLALVERQHALDPRLLQQRVARPQHALALTPSRRTHGRQRLRQLAHRLGELRVFRRQYPLPAGIRVDLAVEIDGEERGDVVDEVPPHCDSWNSRNRTIIPRKGGGKHRRRGNRGKNVAVCVEFDRIAYPRWKPRLSGRFPRGAGCTDSCPEPRGGCPT